MGHACMHPGHEPPEHPVVAVIAILAILGAMLLIAWAGVELHGTHDLEAALAEPAPSAEAQPRPDARSQEEREREAAVTASRFATGFSP